MTSMSGSQLRTADPDRLRWDRLHTPALLAAGLAVAALYVAAGRIGLALAVVNPSATPVWAPTGIAIAACLVFGPRIWPGIFLAALVVNTTTSGSVPISLGIAIGNTLEAVLGAFLVRRFARGPRAFERAHDVFRFAGLAAALAPLVSASIGTFSLLLGGSARPADIPSVWLTWWLGDAGGALIVAPLLITWMMDWSGWTWRSAAERVALLAILAAVGAIVFAGFTPFASQNYPVEFLTIPVLVWAALRFGPRGISLSVAVLSVIAIYGTLQGTGPFVTMQRNESLLLLQGFMGVIALTSLVLAATVAERRQAQHTARESEEQLRLVSERQQAEEALNAAQAIAHLGSWEWDIESNRITWSDEMYRIYGLDPGEKLDYEGYLARIHPEDRERVTAIVGSSTATHEPFDYFHRIVRPDGTELILEARGAVVTDENGRAIKMRGTGHDVSALKRAEEEHALRLRAEERAVALEQVRQLEEDFLASVSHDLKTPLTAIKGHAQLLLRRIEMSQMPPESLTNSLTVILNRSNQMARLVEQILDASHMQAGGYQPRRAPCDLVTCVTAVIEHLGPDDRQRIDLRAAEPTLVGNWEQQRIEQVVENLVSNALKYSPPSERVEIAVGRLDGDAHVAVTDRGIGMPQDELGAVFQRFYRTRNASESGVLGTGLGLYICRGIISAHGGRVWAESAGPGHGSTFHFTLPPDRCEPVPPPGAVA